MKCKVTEGATEEDVTRHMGFQEAISYAGKCLASCVEEAIGIVIRNHFYFNFLIVADQAVAWGTDVRSI